MSDQATAKNLPSAAPCGLDGADSQTIVDLYKQLQSQGHGREDLTLVHGAYLLVVELCTCQYRSSGRSLIDHCVGTASILAALRRDPRLVAAGVAHPVYLHGDFGTVRRRIDDRKRRWVRDRVGDSVEEYLHRYAQLEWLGQTLPQLHDRLPTLDPIDQNTVLMRLADQLDIYGRRDALYTNNLSKRREYGRGSAAVQAAIATRLGHEDLAVALRRAFAQLEDSVPPELTVPVWKDDVIIPPSYRIRPTIALYQRLRSQLYTWIGR